MYKGIHRMNLQKFRENLVDERLDDIEEILRRWMTANGEVQTREEATVHGKQLDLFVKVMLLEENPSVFSLG